MTVSTYPRQGWTSLLAKSINMPSLWIMMAWQDVRQRYRGSLIGPFWITGSLAATSLGIGLLYSKILGTDPKSFVPFVTAGLFVWTLISLTIIEGCGAFLSAASLLRNSPLPIYIHVFRAVTRNLVVLAHNVVVLVAVFLFFRVVPTPAALLAIPGLLLLVANLTWIVFIVATLSARFRDIPQVVTYGVQFAIFVTPVFWPPESLRHNHAVLLGNPFYYMLEVVRGPLLGTAPAPTTWFFLLGMLAFGLVLSAVVAAKFGRKIVFWV